MDKEKLIAAGIDYDEGLNRFAGSAAVYEKFLLKFVEDDTFAKLEEAMLKKDYATGFLMAHTAKGVAGNMSVNRYFKSVSELTDELRNNPTDRAIELFEIAKRDYLEAVAAIKDNE